MTKNKRFLVFEFYEHEACGGLRDLAGSYDSLEEAEEEAKISRDGVQIFDCGTRAVLLDTNN